MLKSKRCIEDQPNLLCTRIYSDMHKSCKGQLIIQNYLRTNNLDFMMCANFLSSMMWSQQIFYIKKPLIFVFEETKSS
jgi:hypothetical protein